MKKNRKPTANKQRKLPPGHEKGLQTRLVKRIRQLKDNEARETFFKRRDEVKKRSDKVKEYIDKHGSIPSPPIDSDLLGYTERQRQIEEINKKYPEGVKMPTLIPDMEKQYNRIATHDDIALDKDGNISFWNENVTITKELLEETKNEMKEASGIQLSETMTMELHDIDRSNMNILRRLRDELRARPDYVSDKLEERGEGVVLHVELLREPRLLDKDIPLVILSDKDTSIIFKDNNEEKS